MLPFALTNFNVSLAVLIMGTLFTMYLRHKTALDSNIPLLYYAVMIAYTNSVDGSLSPWIIYAGAGLALILRFEFMNNQIIRLAIFSEHLLLAVIAYKATATLLRWT